MTRQQQPTRRDWFRLRKPAAPSADASESALVGDQNSSRLAPVELPPNHDGMDLNELPPMREAQLTAAEVESLFDDIATLGSEILLMQRAVGAERASAAKLDSRAQLAVARNLLLSGNAQRIQVRYRWQESLWIDTLNNTGNAFRLIRIQHARD